MRFIEKLQLIERIDQMIRMKSTGSSRELAKKVGVSKSTLYEIFSIMKSMGAEIQYCTCKRSYYYQSNKKLTIGYEQSNKILGGINIFYTPLSPEL